MLQKKFKGVEEKLVSDTDYADDMDIFDSSRDGRSTDVVLGTALMLV